MNCVYCHNPTQVKNSRLQIKTNKVWRRRMCTSCQSTFTTIESPQLIGSLAVLKNKTIMPFMRDKLLISVYNSLKHRKTALTDATWLTDTIISRLDSYISNATIKNIDIINETLVTLKRFDKTSESYYRAFHKG